MNAKRLVMMAASVGLVAVLLRLAPRAAAQEPAMPMPKMAMKTVEPSPEAKALFKKIKAYRSWAKFPENTQPKLSKSHGDMYVVAFHNDVVTKAMKAHTLPLPDGAIIVKENRPKPNAKPAGLTVMSKQDGAWYWMKATPAGKVFVADDTPLAGTDVQMCASCHVARKANDYLYTHDFSK